MTVPSWDAEQADAIQRTREAVTLLVAGDSRDAWQVCAQAADPRLLAVSLASMLATLVMATAESEGQPAGEWWATFAMKHATTYGV